MLPIASKQVIAEKFDAISILAPVNVQRGAHALSKLCMEQLQQRRRRRAAACETEMMPQAQAA
jgi:hypothetical protein